MLVGYARVSTVDQNLELQLTALNKVGCEKIYQDQISGAKINRPDLNMLTHGDIAPDNVFDHDGPEGLQLIDFEWCAPSQCLIGWHLPSYEHSNRVVCKSDSR